MLLVYWIIGQLYIGFVHLVNVDQFYLQIILFSGSGFIGSDAYFEFGIKSGRV